VRRLTLLALLGLVMLPPMVTPLATIEERDAIHGRQISKTCGFFKFSPDIGRDISGFSWIGFTLESHDKLMCPGF
jgi:hypothetical protein